MPSVKVTVNIERDGVAIAGYPVVKRIETDEYALLSTDKTDDGDGTTFTQLSSLGSVQFAAVASDQQVTVRFDGQTDAGILLNAGGLILIMDAVIDAGAATNITVNNNLQPTANIETINAGT